MKKLLLSFLVFIAILLPCRKSMAQTTLQTVDFEAAGGYTTSVVEYLTNTDAYYGRLNYNTNSGSISVPAAYTGYQGNWIFAMEDTGGPTETQTMTLSSVNVSGYFSLQVKVLVAGQNNTAGTLEVNKHMSFYANIDGSGDVLIGSFRGDGSHSYLYKDDNLNGVIESGETTVLTSAFTEYTFNISGTGNSIVISTKCLLSTMNEEGAYDNIRVLGTLVSTPPTATTNAATSVSSTGATLNGSINANNASTTVTFEYGLTTGYGTSVTATPSPVTGSSATSVSKAITGLTAGTTYHYRVKGVNAGGTTYGSDQTFTTSAAGVLLNTSPTLTFTSNSAAITGDFIASDGEGGSQAISDIDIQVYNISDTDGTLLSVLSWQNNGFLGSNNGAYSGLTNENNAGSKGMAIKSSDGSEFRINQFVYYNWGESTPFTNTVKGYRNTDEVASTTFQGYDAEYDPQTVVLDATFANVDEVRIYISGGGYVGDQSATNHSINSIQVGSPVANNAPTDIALSASSINENVVSNSTVGSLSSTDPDAGNTFTYSLVAGTGDTDNASFNISGNSLRITNSPNYEVKSSYSVRIRTTDQGSLTFEEAFTITINDLNEYAIVTTQAVSSITSTTATGNGNITDLGSPNPTAYGICWNTTGTPTISDSKVDLGAVSATGAFTASMTGLSLNTTYYVRAFATNTAGTSYGSEVNFATLASAPTITSTPTLTAPYGKPYSYNVVATMEGELETTLTTPTKPEWLDFSSEGQNKASLFGNVPDGKLLSGVAGDTEGNIYAITNDGTEIYKIGADGTTTLWRSGLIAGSVYALHISNGYIYIPRYYNSAESITRIPLADPLAAEEIFATLPGGVLSLTDKDGWIYAADYSSRQVSRINETTKVSQLLLSSSDGLPPGGPFGLTFGDDGNLYVATWGNTSIIRYDGTLLLTGSPGTPTTVVSGLPGSVSSIRQDKNGYFYLAMSGGGVQKYTNDFSSFQVVSLNENDDIWSLSFTTSGALVYSRMYTNEVYRLQTGALLTGTPAKTDLGDHAVVIRATNSAGYTEQSFTIKVIDNVAPVITAKTPANSATNVALQPTLSLTFDEEVSLGDAGALSLYNGATLLKSFDLSVPAEKALVVLSEDHLALSVSLTENLPVNTAVTVGVGAGFVKDVHNNNFIGFTAASNTWKFTTINKNEQTITFPAIAAKTYGDATFTLGDAKTDRDLTVTYTAEDPTVVSITGNQATILKAGSTKITATQAGDGSNFAATPVERTLTVNKAELTVTADNQTKVYGEANPTLTFEYSGWVNGEETIDTPPTISTTVSGATAVGTHADAITFSGGTDNNYTFNFEAGDFDVTKAELTVTADNQTKVYGAANPTLTFKYSGWVNGEETIDTPPTASTTVTGTSAVDTYEDAIALSGGSDNNYTFMFVSGDFDVTKAELTVTADNQTKVYGAINPTLTFKYSGWVNGEETIDTPPTISTTVDETSGANTYTGAITLSGGSDDSYTFKLVAGDFEVTKAELTVTADNQTKAYGEANPTLTFQYSGWVNGEEIINTPPMISTTVDAASLVGIYVDAITLSGGSDNNYTFNYVAGDFEVAKAELTVTADKQTKVYGSVNPTLTFHYSGWINGEETIDTPPTISTTVDVFAAVDTYIGVIKLSGGSDDRYTLKLVAGDFEVTKAELTVTADNQTKTYGSANPALTFKYSGWVDEVEKIDTPPTISTTVDINSGVGEYSNAIALTGGFDNNYTFNLVPGNFEVTKAELKIAAGDQSKCYDGQVFSGENKAVLSGFVNGEDQSDLTGNLSFTGDYASAVLPGNYAIVPGGLSSANYNIVYQSGNLTIRSLPTAKVSGDQEICTGTFATINVALTGEAPWTVTVFDGTKYQTVENITKNLYTFNVTGDAGTSKTYTITEVSDFSGCSSTGEGSVTITVRSHTFAGEISGDQLIAPGTFPAPIVSVSPGSGEGTITYAWQSSIDQGYNWEVIPDVTDDTYSPEVPEVPVWFRRITIATKNGVSCSAVSEPVKIKIWATGVIDSESAAELLKAFAVKNTAIHVKGSVSKLAVAKLYDIQGRLILVKNLQEGSLNVIPTNIRTGIYLLIVKDGERIQEFKLPVRE